MTSYRMNRKHIYVVCKVGGSFNLAYYVQDMQLMLAPASCTAVANRPIILTGKFAFLLYDSDLQNSYMCMM